MKEFIALGFILGTALGSFIKVLADRSINQKSFGGRSYCESCQKKLKWYDLFPILSYLLTKGKCRYCQDKLPLEYLLVELLMGFLIALVFYTTIPQDIFSLDRARQLILTSDILFKTFITSVLIVVFLTDIKTGMIYDRITFPAIIIAFFYLILNTILKAYLIYQNLISSALGKYLLPPKSDYLYRHILLAADPLIFGLIGAMVMALFFGGLIFITKGRGMGGGDLKLGVFLGLVFGFPNIITVLMLAFLSGALVGIGLLLSNKKKFGQTIPFGPFLSLGGLVVLFSGDQLLNWYLNINWGTTDLLFPLFK